MMPPQVLVSGPKSCGGNEYNPAFRLTRKLDAMASPICSVQHFSQQSKSLVRKCDKKVQQQYH